MKNKILKTVLAAGLAASVNQAAQAVPITGNIGFAGQATLDSAHADTSTEVLSWAKNAIPSHTCDRTAAQI